jgi:hypothetical protein
MHERVGFVAALVEVHKRVAAKTAMLTCQSILTPSCVVQVGENEIKRRVN